MRNSQLRRVRRPYPGGFGWRCHWAFGVSQLAQPISEFLDRHPDIRIEVDLNDRRQDLIEENIDLAIRIGELEDSTLIARKLANVHFAVCASPEYLRVHGEPRHPAEVANMKCWSTAMLQSGGNGSISAMANRSARV